MSALPSTKDLARLGNAITPAPQADGQVRKAAHRILELYDDAMRDLLDSGAHDSHPDSDELAELRRIVGAPAHRWTPAPDAEQPAGEAEPEAWRSVERKFYRSEWPLANLLEARNGGGDDVG